jgi:hypothetical protein
VKPNVCDAFDEMYRWWKDVDAIVRDASDKANFVHPIGVL